jgi:hypothetical protein
MPTCCEPQIQVVDFHRAVAILLIRRGMCSDDIRTCETLHSEGSLTVTRPNWGVGDDQMSEVGKGVADSGRLLGVSLLDQKYLLDPV